MLTLERFKQLVASYGADLERWPPDTQHEARAVLRSSAEARRLVAQAQSLDDALARAGTVEDTRAPAETAAALARLRAGVAARIATQEPVRRAGFLTRWVSSLETLLPHLQPGWGKLVTGGVLAIAAGLAIGLLYSANPPQSNVLSLLESSTLPILSDSMR